MKHTTAPLQPGMYYHIYNRGNNRENLFLEKRNYPYFLTLYAKHIEPIADTCAYCLLRNHFHLSVRIKTEKEFIQSSFPTCSTPTPKPSTKDMDGREVRTHARTPKSGVLPRNFPKNLTIGSALCLTKVV